MVLPRYVDYQGERRKLTSFDDALAEYNAQKAQGLKPVIYSYGNGYIVTKAIFKKEGGETGGKV